MPGRRQLILDGSAIRTEDDLHRALAELLGFFNGYGRNLDALWDVLGDDDLREVRGEVEVLWRSAATFAQHHPDYFASVERLFAETKEPISLLVSL